MKAPRRLRFGAARRLLPLTALAVIVAPGAVALVDETEGALDGHHHHHHHHGHNSHRGHDHHRHDSERHHQGHRHHHGHHGHPADGVAHDQVAHHGTEQSEDMKPGAEPKVVVQAAQAPAAVSDEVILQKLQSLDNELSAKEKSALAMKAAPASPPASPPVKGKLEVNAPLPMDFSARFASAVAQATGCDPSEVKLLGAAPVADSDGHLDEVVFEAKGDVISAVKSQAADPMSKLANGPLHLFLVAHDSVGALGASVGSSAMNSEASPEEVGEPEGDAPPEVDSSMPYGGLEPFGREDTAKELTDSSIRESDAMVDQLERAEVAEEKRAVFRALTRLRGAAITSFDGVARAQTGNLDEYSRKNQWRSTHPLHHLAQDESDVSRWAFPENADF
mmetsp:Transcript_112485/g.282932  ORF Transcript_112485/g.282932 Transcript_112485/m.282932 type:complete len:392 (+) Transcript_112485:64-1239(+)